MGLSISCYASQEEIFSAADFPSSDFYTNTHARGRICQEYSQHGHGEVNSSARSAADFQLHCPSIKRISLTDTQLALGFTLF